MIYNLVYFFFIKKCTFCNKLLCDTKSCLVNKFVNTSWLVYVCPFMPVCEVLEVKNENLIPTAKCKLVKIGLAETEMDLKKCKM